MALQKWRLSSILLLSTVVSVSLLWASDASATSPCQEAISAFLNMPADQTAAAVSGPNEASCWAVIESSNTDFDRLVHWAEQGNQWAAQYLAKHLKQLDGGNLEDALVALGQFSEHDTRRKKVLAVARKELSQQKVQALNAIDESASEIRSKNPGLTR